MSAPEISPERYLERNLESRSRRLGQAVMGLFFVTANVGGNFLSAQLASAEPARPAAAVSIRAAIPGQHEGPGPDGGVAGAIVEAYDGMDDLDEGSEPIGETKSDARAEFDRDPDAMSAGPALKGVTDVNVVNPNALSAMQDITAHQPVPMQNTHPA